MNEQIKYLIQLQNLDSRIIKLEKEKEELPRKKEEEKIVYENFKNKIEGLNQELKELKVRQKEKEVDLESREGEIKKLQLQLYKVKDNKSYSLLQQEISSKKTDNSIIEEETLKLLDEIDEKEKEVKQGEEELAKIRQVMEKNLQRINQRMAELDKKIDELKKEREKMTPMIDSSILAKYEKILRNKKDSIAIVSIKDGTCQGCFMTLPPQLINEVKMGTKIVTCENCSRILYLED